MDSDYRNNDSLDFGQLIRVLLMQSKLLIGLFFLGGILVVGNYLISPKLYSVTSLLQLYSNNSNLQMEPGMNFLLGSSNTSSINNIKELYKSRSIMMQALIEQKHNLTFKEDQNSFRDYIEIIRLKNKISSLSEIKLNLLDDTFDIYIDDRLELSELNYGIIHENENIEIKLFKPDNLNEIKFSYNNPSLIVNNFTDRFVVSNPAANIRFQNENIIRISYLTQNIQDGIDVLNKANELFLLNNIKTETENARLAIDFLDKRLVSVNDRLEEAKNQLADFRRDNQSVNVDLEIQSIIESLKEIESKINEVDIEIATSINVVTETNPLFQELLKRKNELEEQKLIIQGRIQNLPNAQQEFVDLYKNVEISEELFRDLMQKRLEFSITEASTLGNIRIVDKAYLDKKVSPVLLSVFLNFTIFAFLSLILVVVRGLYFLPITNPAELPDRKINTSILGVIPQLTESEENVLINEDERFNQSIESTIVNINNLLEDKTDGKAKTILITSPTAANGKSFIARNLVRKLTKVNKKVLLIDLDMKRGDQHKVLDTKKITKEEFLSLDSTNIEKIKYSEGYYFIPKITKLTSSFQFLYSPQFENKINLLKEIFDVIVLDTAPLLSVSDSSILMAYSDLNIAMVRHGITKINEIKQLRSIAQQVGIDIDGFIYNGYERPSSYYGYYQLYGNYEYQYYAKKYLYSSYDYDSKD